MENSKRTTTTENKKTRKYQYFFISVSFILFLKTGTKSAITHNTQTYRTQSVLKLK